MASYLIKNQVLKHLSRFFKNLNPNQLSTSSSTIQLKDLELNEDALKYLFLMSPASDENESSLIRISSARCTALTLVIPWTSITTAPICINFDQLFITVEILETPATTPTDKSHDAKLDDETEKSYGFVDKIIDGISFSLNSLHVKLKASKFTASLDLSFLKANPSPPNFKNFAGKKPDLRLSRLKCAPFVLLFRTISWQTLKIEAKASGPHDQEYETEEESYQRSTSDVVRLISSGGSAQLTVKKSLLNRQVVCIRTNLMLDDILWLLTSSSSQSRGSIALIESIGELVVKMSATGHNSSSSALAVHPGPTLPAPATKPTPNRSPSKSSITTANAKVDTNSSLYKIYAQFDPIESSVRLTLKTFQLQIVDDVNVTDGSFHSKFPPLSAGSALLFSATGVSFLIFPEYNAKRGFKHDVFNDKETSLHVAIKISTIQLHKVGLNDSRLRSRRKTDDEKNQYFMFAPVGVPDVIPAVEVVINHFYDKEMDSGSAHPATDSIHVKLGPMRICLDEPTLLWIHSFVLPLVANTDANDTPATEVPPFMETVLELTMLVLVIEEKNPFDIFPSPFSVTPESCDLLKSEVHTDDGQLEVSCTKLTVQRIRSPDLKLSFAAGPLWIDLLRESTHKSHKRKELIAPLTAKGSVTILPKTPLSMEEVRVMIDVNEPVLVTSALPDLLILLRIADKMGIFADFMARDKLEMRKCCEMDDSLFTMRLNINSAAAHVVRAKFEAKECSEHSETQSLTHVPRSVSAPEEIVPPVEKPLTAPECQLSAGNLLDLCMSTTDETLAASVIAADNVSLSSRFSDEDDHYILNHLNMPVSMSSSPSLLVVSDSATTRDSPTDSVEEAVDVSATLAADFEGPRAQLPENEEIVVLGVKDLVIEKRATDLHGVMTVTTNKPIVISEPLVSSTVTELIGDSMLLVQSELKWSQDKGKQDLTSVLLKDHPQLSVHQKTIEALAGCFSSDQIPNGAEEPVTVPAETPAVSIFLQNFSASVLQEQRSDPVVALKIAAAHLHKDVRNVISLEPVIGSSDLELYLKRRHVETFGPSVVADKLPEKDPVDAVLRSSEEDVVSQLLREQELLQQKVKELQEENSRLKERCLLPNHKSE